MGAGSKAIDLAYLEQVAKGLQEAATVVNETARGLPETVNGGPYAEKVGEAMVELSQEARDLVARLQMMSLMVYLALIRYRLGIDHSTRQLMRVLESLESYGGVYGAS